MPQRSNDFQDLVTLIQEALAPAGAKVTSSALVAGSSSGRSREIDVLIETPVGPYSIKIAVEAKDEGRKIDATKMETIIGKYRSRGSILVNKVVVVSHRGFTQEAEVRARDEDIALYTINDITSDHLLELMPKVFNIHFDPFPLPSDFDPGLPSDVDKLRATQEGRLICNCHGYDYGSPAFWTSQFIFHQVMPNRNLMGKMEEIALGERGKADLHVPMPITNHLLRLDGIDYQVKTITFNIRYIRTAIPMTSKRYEIRGDSGSITNVMHSAGESELYKVKLLFPQGCDDARGVLKIEDTPASAHDAEYKGPTWQWDGSQWTILGAKKEPE